MPKCMRCSMRTGRKSNRQEEIEKNVKISFHRFPVDEVRKLSWMEAMGLDEKDINMNSVLCSLHFAKSDFDRTFSTRPRLKDNVIPSVIAPIIETVEIKSLDIVREIPTQNKIVPKTSHSTEFTVNTSQINKDAINSLIYILRAMQRGIALHPSAIDLTVNIPQSVTEKATNFKCLLHAANTELTLETSHTATTSETAVGTAEIREHHLEQDSNDNDEFTLNRRKYYIALDHSYQGIDETPRKKMLRATISEQKSTYVRKIRTLMQKNRRQEKVIHNFDGILEELVQEKLPTDKYINLMKRLALRKKQKKQKLPITHFSPH